MKKDSFIDAPAWARYLRRLLIAVGAVCALSLALTVTMYVREFYDSRTDFVASNVHLGLDPGCCPLRAYMKAKGELAFTGYGQVEVYLNGRIIVGSPGILARLKLEWVGEGPAPTPGDRPLPPYIEPATRIKLPAGSYRITLESGDETAVREIMLSP